MRFWLLLLIIIIIIIIITSIIIIIIIIVIIVFELKQWAIIKQALIGLACVEWARNYLITGCAREARKGERRPPLLFSPPPPPLPPAKLAPATQAMIGPTLETGWGSLESYLSRRMPVRWHATESGAEIIGSWQNLL